MSPQEALTRVIEHREIFHEEMLKRRSQHHHQGAERCQEEIRDLSLRNGPRGKKQSDRDPNPIGSGSSII